MLLRGQDRVHLNGRLPLEFSQHMRVGIQGNADVRVPQGLHDEAGVDTLDQKESRAAMAKVMKPLGPETGGFEDAA